MSHDDTVTATIKLTSEDAPIVVTYPDVFEFVANVIVNVRLAEMALRRSITPTRPDTFGNHLTWRFVYADDGELFMTVEADRLVDRTLH